MTNKLKILIGINIVLIGTIVSTFWLNNLQTTEQAQKIAFGLGNWQNLSGLRVDDTKLSLQNGHWRLENGEIANTEHLLKLLSTVDRIAVLNELSKNEINTDAYTAKEVEFFVGDVGVKKLQFLENQHEILVSEDGQNWYSIYLPGSELALNNVLGNDLAYWQNNQAFPVTWRTLNYFKVSYPGDTQNSLDIKFDKDFYKVDQISALDSAMLYNYISQLPKIKVIESVNRPTLIDSLNKYQAFCLVSYEDMNGLKAELEVYPTDEFVYLRSKSDQKIIAVLPQEFQNVLVSRKLFEKK